MTSPTDTACRASRPVTITDSEGYISNSVTEDTNCGGIDSPWLLRALPGQRINITLLDYGALLTRDKHRGIQVCQVNNQFLIAISTLYIIKNAANHVEN